MCGRNRGGVTTEADLWYLVGMSYRLRRSSTLPITLLLASLTGCPDDPMGDGTTGDDSTGSSTGAMTMTTAPTTMTTAMTSDGTGTGTESSSGPGPDSTANEGESSSSGGPVGPEIEVSIDMTAVATGDLFDVAETVALCERAFRGGGVARDVVYLRGWLRVRAALAAREATVDEVRWGRVGVADVPALRALAEAGWLRPPPYTPSLARSLRSTEGGTRLETSPPSLVTSLTRFEAT